VSISERELRELVHKRLRELLDEEEVQLSSQEKGLVTRQIGDSIVGLGPLEPFVRDPDITEIMVNGHETIYVERAGKLYWSGAKFHDEDRKSTRLNSSHRTISYAVFCLKKKKKLSKKKHELIETGARIRL